MYWPVILEEALEQHSPCEKNFLWAGDVAHMREEEKKSVQSKYKINDR
jgi:hypothetical protein